MSNLVPIYQKHFYGEIRKKCRSKLLRYLQLYWDRLDYHGACILLDQIIDKCERMCYLPRNLNYIIATIINQYNEKTREYPYIYKQTFVKIFNLHMSTWKNMAKRLHLHLY